MTTVHASLLGIFLLTLCVLPAAASANSYDPGSVGAKLQVTMEESGEVRVSGARVRSVSDSGFTAETLWGAGKLTWTVRTDENTPITRKSGARITLTEITAGDYVSFSGTIQTNMAPFTVDADAVRDWSVSDNHTMVSGTVSEFDPEAGTLTLTTGKGRTVTVTTTGKTVYAQNGARSLSDFANGDTVLAFGVQSGDRLTAVKLNLQERLVTNAHARPELATGLGSWVDSFLPRFFAGRFN